MTILIGQVHCRKEEWLGTLCPRSHALKTFWNSTNVCELHMILSCAAHKWETAVLRYPLRSYRNFEVGHLHGNGTLETEVHETGTDVRVDCIQGCAAPLKTSCENNVRQCITLNIMKALKFT